MKALKLFISKALTIEYNNKPTIRLLVDKSITMQTKLRHTNIYSYWLKPEV